MLALFPLSSAPIASLGGNSNKELLVNASCSLESSVLLKLTHDLESSLSSLLTTYEQLYTHKLFDSNISATINTVTTLILIHDLSTNETVTAVSNSPFLELQYYMQSNCTVTIDCNPILDKTTPLISAETAVVTSNSPFLELQYYMQSNCTVTIDCNPILDKTTPLISTESCTLTINTSYVQLQYYMQVAADVTASTYGLLYLDKNLESNILDFAETYATVDINRELNSLESCTASIISTLYVDKLFHLVDSLATVNINPILDKTTPLISSESCMLTINTSYVQLQYYMQVAADAIVTTYGLLYLDKNLESNILDFAETYATVDINRELNSSESCTASIISTLYVDKLFHLVDSTATANINPILDKTTPLISSESCTLTINTSYVQLQYYMQVNANINAEATSLLYLDKNLESNILDFADTYATVDINRELNSSESCSATIISTLYVHKLFHLVDSAATANINPILDKTTPLISTESCTLTINTSYVQLQYYMQVAVDVTAAASSLLYLDKNLESNILDFADTYANADVNKVFSSSITVTVEASSVMYVERGLQSSEQSTCIINPLFIDIQKNLESNILDFAETNVSVGVNRMLETNISVSATITNQILTNKLCVSTCTGTLEATYVAIELEKYSSSSIDCTANIYADLNNGVLFDSNIYATLTNESALILDNYLESNATVLAGSIAELKMDNILISSIEVSINVDFSNAVFLYSSISVACITYSLLDIDNNTIDSPGGIPAAGFYPPTNIILFRVPESSETIVKTVTVDIDDILPSTITSVIYNINPRGVITHEIIDNTVTFTVALPRQIYDINTNFVSSYNLTPIADIITNYLVQFDTKFVSISSSEFDLPGMTKSKLMNVGDKIYAINEYLTKEVGYIQDTNVLLKQAQIISKENITITASSSLDNVPTPGFYNTINSNRIQLESSSQDTISMTEYEKDDQVEDIWITITAVCDNVEYTATYKALILPDYDMGKELLLQAIG